MATVFTKVINGELPGRFVYRDERCVAFLTIAPMQPGHTLVVPIEEYDHWLDLPADLNQHLFAVSKKVGDAIQQVFNPVKVGLIIAGLEVPHVHIHLVPIWHVRDMDFDHQDPNPDQGMMDDAMEKIRRAVGWQPEG